MPLHNAIYHYCPPGAFLEILKSHSIWLTHISYFEDQEELTWFERIVLERMRARDLKLEKPYHRELEEYLKLDKFSAIFCASFSTEWDMLSQWNAYADNGRGFAIAFNRRKLEELRPVDEKKRPIRLELADVIYNVEEQHRIADRFLDDLDKITQALTGVGENPTGAENFPQFAARHNIWWYSAMCKNPLFMTENEVRWIQRDSGAERFRMRGSQVVPYVALDFMPDPAGESPIEAIVFGPRVPCPQKNTNSIGLLMERFDYKSPPKFLSSNLKLI